MIAFFDFLGTAWTAVIIIGLALMVVQSFFKHYKENNLKEFFMYVAALFGGLLAIFIIIYIIMDIAPKALS